MFIIRTYKILNRFHQPEEEKLTKLQNYFYNVIYSENVKISTNCCGNQKFQLVL